MEQTIENDELIDEVIKLMLGELTWRIQRVSRKVRTLPLDDERRSLLTAMFTQWRVELERVEKALDLPTRSAQP